MIKLSFTLALLLSVSVVSAQADTSFKKRLNVFMKLNRDMDFDGMMNYIHPSIFKIAPREQIVEVFKNSFDNQMIKMSIDSLFILKISSDFRLGDTVYRKVDYGMLATLKFKDTSLKSDTAFISRTTENLKKGFADGTITYNQAMDAFEIRTNTLLIAIKDGPSVPWMFLGYQKNEDLLRQIFPAEVISHFKLL
jgi:hypothetical protein